MDQVDKLIISSLRSIGCDLEEEVICLSQFGLEEVVSSTVACLKAIKPEVCGSLSNKLPQNMAMRFRAAAAIAQHVKDIGYSGDLGYQSLLYPNEVDIRRLFSFLLERLPKDHAEIHQENMTGANLLLAKAKQQIQMQLSRPWIPPHCRSALIKSRNKSNTTKDTSSMPYGDVRGLSDHRIIHSLPLGANSSDVKLNVAADVFVSSLLAAHALQLQRMQLLPSISSTEDETPYGLESFQQKDLLSVPSPSSDSLVTPLSPLSPLGGGVEAMEEQEREGEDREKVEDLSNTLQTLLSLKVETEVKLEEEKSAITELSESLSAAEVDLKQTEGEITALERSVHLLSSSEDNVTRLKGIIASSDQKMAKLRHKFSSHCGPLDEKIEALNNHLGEQKQLHLTISDEIQTLRQKRATLIQDIPRLEEQKKTLTEKLDDRGQAIGRSFYTKNILELTSKVHKQRQITAEILKDIRGVQKEINTLSGKIDRSFTVIEEVSYKASWSNSKSTPLYRSVIGIHEGCNAVVQTIRETGALKRQCAELSEMLMLEKRRDVSSALDKLQQDLTAVKKENAQLKTKLSTK